MNIYTAIQNEQRLLFYKFLRFSSNFFWSEYLNETQTINNGYNWVLLVSKSIFIQIFIKNILIQLGIKKIKTQKIGAFWAKFSFKSYKME